MKASVFNCRLLLLLLFFSLWNNRGQAQNNDADSLNNQNYLRHIERYQNNWMRHIPNLSMLQWAGNIGFLSAGIGWDYGKNNRWETHMLLGYLPAFVMSDDMFSFSVKQNLQPWQIGINDQYSVTPAVFSFTANTVLNHEFWYREKEINGEDNYYRFSSKFRVHIGVGSRINMKIPEMKRRLGESISLYYELSTYDLAIISALSNRKEHRIRDIVALGFGIQYRFF